MGGSVKMDQQDLKLLLCSRPSLVWSHRPSGDRLLRPPSVSPARISGGGRWTTARHLPDWLDSVPGLLPRDQPHALTYVTVLASTRAPCPITSHHPQGPKVSVLTKSTAHPGLNASLGFLLGFSCVPSSCRGGLSS